MGRGKERTVVCAKCGRQTRRDKAVFIDKPIFVNPLERKDVVDEEYTRMVTREFAYCPSCGKHLRIYDKKKKQNEAKREREQNRMFTRSKPERPAYGHAIKPRASEVETQTAPVEPKEETPIE